MKVGSKSLYFLLLVVSVAAGLRIAYIANRAAVIENEGAMYGMMADDLLAGREFPKVPTETRPQLVMGWFYPLTIASTDLFIHQTELAARLVSLIAGTSLVILVFLLASRLYGPSAAWIAAVLAALFPVLVDFSGAAYCETLYMALLVGGLYCAIRCFDESRGHAWIWAGVLFGCAYLTRSEALVIPFLTVFFILTLAKFRRFDMLSAVKASAGLLLVFSLFVLPYAMLFRIYTGHFLLEGKNRMNYTIGERILSGMPPSEATRGIDGNAHPVGPQLDLFDNLAWSPYPMGLGDLSRYYLHEAARNKGWIYRQILPSYVFGSVLLWVLAALGLFAEGWSLERLTRESYLLTIFGYIFFVLLGAQMPLLRYSLPVFPFGLLWASKGLTSLGAWAKQTTLSLSERWGFAANLNSLLFTILPILVMLGLSAANAGTVGELSESFPDNLGIKQAGIWLRAHSQPHSTVMSYESSIPFYAHADWLPLPYANSQLALQYVALKHPDFVAISYQMSGTTPYATDWLNHGIPDPHAQLVYDSNSPSPGHRIRIYRWIDSRSRIPGSR
jgi:hypothetical protein